MGEYTYFIGIGRFKKNVPMKMGIDECFEGMHQDYEHCADIMREKRILGGVHSCREQCTDIIGNIQML